VKRRHRRRRDRGCQRFSRLLVPSFAGSAWILPRR